MALIAAPIHPFNAIKNSTFTPFFYGVLDVKKSAFKRIMFFGYNANTMKIIFISILLSIHYSAFAEVKKILIIGDSISIGYTPYLKSLMKESAYVDHNEGNAQSSSNVLENLPKWLKDQSYDVIYFNVGLWDIAYRQIPNTEYPAGKLDKVNGTLTTTPSEYKNNIEKIVKILKKTDSKLVWANTTKVPNCEPGRKQGTERQYNKIALQVINKYDVQVSDLYKLTDSFSNDMFMKPCDVHYNQNGYKAISAKVFSDIKDLN